jgi:hypothetical protein
VISALRGRCPGPLDECGPVKPGEPSPGPVGMIPALRYDHRHTTNAPVAEACGVPLEAVHVQEATDGIGDLLVAFFAEHEAVV